MPKNFVPIHIERQPPPRICATCGHWGVEDGPDDGSAFAGYCECLLSRNCDQIMYFDHGCDHWQECPQLEIVNSEVTHA